MSGFLYSLARRSAGLAPAGASLAAPSRDALSFPLATDDDAAVAQEVDARADASIAERSQGATDAPGTARIFTPSPEGAPRVAALTPPTPATAPESAAPITPAVRRQARSVMDSASAPTPQPAPAAADFSARDALSSAPPPRESVVMPRGRVVGVASSPAANYATGTRASSLAGSGAPVYPLADDTEHPGDAAREPNVLVHESVVPAPRVRERGEIVPYGPRPHTAPSPQPGSVHVRIGRLEIRTHDAQTAAPHSAPPPQAVDRFADLALARHYLDRAG